MWRQLCQLVDADRWRVGRYASGGNDRERAQGEQQGEGVGMTLNKRGTFNRGAADALKHFDKYAAFRYSFPIGPRVCVLYKQREGHKARGTWDRQVYNAATVETVIERIREEMC